MYAEKLCFLCCFLHIFPADFGTIRQNKIGFSDDILRIFLHKPTLVGIPPCLILRKFARRGPSVFRKKGCRDLDTPPTLSVHRTHALSLIIPSFSFLLLMTFLSYIYDILKQYHSVLKYLEL